jgi:hypothetical protein
MEEMNKNRKKERRKGKKTFNWRGDVAGAEYAVHCLPLLAPCSARQTGPGAQN